MKYATNHIRSNVTRLVAVAALLTFLACGIGSSVFFAGEKAANLPPELAVVPQDAFLFVHVRPADLWDCDILAKLRVHYPKLAALPALPFGIDPKDIDSISLVFATPRSFDRFMDEDFMPTFGIGRPKKAYPPKETPKGFEGKDKEKDKDKDADKEKDKEKFEPKAGKSEGSQAQDEPSKKDASPKKDFDEPKKDFDEPKKGLSPPQKKGYKEFVFPPRPPMMIVVTWVKPYDQEKIKVMLGKEGKEETHNGKTYLTSADSNQFAVHFLNEKTLLAVSPSWIKTILERPPAERAQGAQAAGLDLAMKKRPLAIGVNMLEPAAQEGMKQAAEQMKNPWSDAPLVIYPLLSARSAWLGVDLGKENRVQVNAALYFADPASANEALGAARDASVIGRIFLVGQLASATRVQAEDNDDPVLFFAGLALKQVDTAWRGAVIERRQAAIQLRAEATLDVDALRAQAEAAAKSNVKDEATLELIARTKSTNNIKKIMLAMHNYHDVYKMLPPAAKINRADGRPLLSWRVAILPYLDEPRLYSEFKQDEPWDSPHNIKLLPRMPKVYAPVRGKTKEPFGTFYQGFAGRGTAFESDVKKVGDRFEVAELSFRSGFPDGTSQTIAIVEAGEAVPWSKPEDLPYDAKQPLPKLGGMFNGGFHVGMVDGSVRYFAGVAKEGVGPADVPKGFVSQQTLRAAITRNDGEPLGPDWVPNGLGTKKP